MSLKDSLMQTEIEKIKLSQSEYHQVNKITFNYESNTSDQIYIDSLLKRAKELSEKVNQHAASNSLQTRHSIVVQANAIAGLLAEDLWAKCINDAYSQQKVHIPVVNDLGNQIDIASLDGKYTFEVRSSFPRNGVTFAVSNERNGFKIVGPYTNQYKKAENPRDFYLTALFPLELPGKILSAIKKDGFSFSLTGGATLDMMDGQNAISFLDNLRPEDSFTEATTEYQVIRIRDGLDYCEVLENIRNKL